MKTITLEPMQWRDYKKKADVLADFDANKDFRIIDLFGGNDGKAVNKPQLAGKQVRIRYNNLAKVMMVTVPEDE
jgi:hypothetical protein